MPRRKGPWQAWFNEKWMLDDNGCWLWSRYIAPDGYGRYQPPGQSSRSAARVSYEIHVGPIPDGYTIDHLCRVRHCVNPAHLEAVPHLENCRRGEAGKYQALKTHCPQGHPYSGDNLYVHNGHRQCRTCCRAAQKRYHARKALSSRSRPQERDDLRGVVFAEREPFQTTLDIRQ